MNIALWIAQGVLAAAFLGAGILKLVKSGDELMPKMPYVEDFSDSAIRGIGLIEVLGAVGAFCHGSWASRRSSRWGQRLDSL